MHKELLSLSKYYMVLTDPLVLMVQISGNFGVAKDALAEIASRLRARCLRDAKALGEPAPIGPHTGYGHPGNIHGGGPPPSGAIGVGSSGGYNHFKVL